MKKYKCTGFLMHGCMRNPDKSKPLICCSSCSQYDECAFACMNSPKLCGMGGVCADVQEPERKKKHKTRPVNALDIDTGEVVAMYDSVEEAAKAVNMSLSPIYHAIRIGRKCGGYKWQYVHKKFEGV